MMKAPILLALLFLAVPLHAQTIVTNADDAGPGSLRDAIAAAAPDETISFDPSLANATIALNSGPLVIDKALNFDPLPLSGVPALDQNVRLDTVGRQEAFQLIVDPASVTGLEDFEIEGRPSKPHYGTYLNLAADDGVAGDGFGDAMAQSGNFLIVGAAEKDGSAGAAYVFTPETVVVPEPAGSRESPVVRRDWLQRAKLVADNAAAGDAFGSTVAVFGRVAVIGAPGEDGAGDATTDSGAAYVFVRDDAGAWTQQAVLRAAIPSASAEFGISVSVEGSLIAVGAPGDETVYLFQQSGSSWPQIAALEADSGVAGDRFGAQVAVAGNRLCVGAPDESSVGFRSGAVYVFTPDAGGIWTQQHFFQGDNTMATDGFGTTLAIKGDQLAVAAPFEDGASDALPDSGAVYLFDLSGAAPVQTAYVKAANAGIADFFGTSIALGAGRLLVGATREDSATGGFDADGVDDDTSNSGAAYLFENSYGDWRQRTFAKAETPVAGEEFGRAVALASDTAFVAAGEEMQAFDTRSQYDFVRAPELSAVAFPTGFGSTLAISGDTLVVGEPEHITPSFSFLGLVHLYRRDGIGWRREQTISGPVGLGTEVAIDGDTMIATEDATVRIFNRTGNTWAAGATLSDVNQLGFARTIALSGDRIAVGTDIPETTTGNSVEIYTRTAGVWTNTHSLPPPPPVSGPPLTAATGIAMSGDKVVVAYTETGNFERHALLRMFGLSSAEPEVPVGSSVGIGGRGAGRQLAIRDDVVLSMANQRVLVFRIPPTGGLAFESQIEVGSFGRTQNNNDDFFHGLSLSAGGLAVGTRDGALHYLPRPAADGTIEWELQRRFQTRTDFVDPEEDLSHTVVIDDSGTLFVGTPEGSAQSANQLGINPLELDDFSSQSGAVFIFERPSPQIALEDSGGMLLAPGSVLAFVSLESGMPVTRNFGLRNDSRYDLELGKLSLTGSDAALYEVVTPPAATIAPGASTTFTLRFNPGPNVNTSARLELPTNLADNDLFTAPLSGIAVDPANDTDGDGLDDAFEAEFASLGFDFLTAQPDLVAAYLATAGRAGSGSNVDGLFSQAQLGALRPDAELLELDPLTGEFTLRLGLGRSTNLMNYTPFPFLPGATTIDPEGRVEFRFTDDADRRFYRLELRD